MIKVHATCVAISDRGVLIRGASGSGKSDLALRLIDQGATLVADDYVELSESHGQVHASAPAILAGLIEVRGLGLLKLPFAVNVQVALLVDLVDPEEIERMPEAATANPGDGIETELPSIAIAPFQSSAEAKIRLALRSAPDACSPQS